MIGTVRMSAFAFGRPIKVPRLTPTTPSAIRDGVVALLPRHRYPETFLGVDEVVVVVFA